MQWNDKPGKAIRSLRWDGGAGSGKVYWQFGWVEAGGEVQRSVPEVAEATEAMEWLEREPLGYGAEPVRFHLGVSRGRCEAAWG